MVFELHHTTVDDRSMPAESRDRVCEGDCVCVRKSNRVQLDFIINICFVALHSASLDDGEINVFEPVVYGGFTKIDAFPQKVINAFI